MSNAARHRGLGLSEVAFVSDNSDKDFTSRRSTRIATDVLVELQGEGFAYAGETITVNLHGALVRVSAPLKLADRITVHVHRTGKSAAAAVVFANHGASEFGIELEDAENIWGVAIPPEDWNTPASEGLRRKRLSSVARASR